MFRGDLFDPYDPLTHLRISISVWGSAKELTPGSQSPQSNFVRVYSDGTCTWWPLFEQSVSHCSIDVTWYPFDSQHCDLSFESWKYNVRALNISALRLEGELFFHYNENEEWNLLGCFLFYCYYFFDQGKPLVAQKLQKKITKFVW